MQLPHSACTAETREVSLYACALVPRQLQEKRGTSCTGCGRMNGGRRGQYIPAHHSRSSSCIVHENKQTRNIKQKKKKDHETKEGMQDSRFTSLLLTQCGLYFPTARPLRPTIASPPNLFRISFPIPFLSPLRPIRARERGLASQYSDRMRARRS